MRILDEIAGQASRSPHRRALVTEAGSLTYRALVEQVERRADAMRRRGFRPGHRLLFSDPVDANYLTALLACAALEVTFVPVSHQAPPAWRERIARMTGAAATVGRLGELGRHAPVGPPSTTPALTILYTSGTEGEPKGVILSQETCEAGARTAIGELGLGPEDVVLNYVPLHLVGGMYILVVPALMRGSSVVLARFNPFAFASTLSAHQPTVTILLPAFLQILRGMKGWDALDLSCFRTLVAGAAVVPRWVPRALLDRGVARFQHFFGMTECLTPVLANRCVSPDDPFATAFDRVCGDYACRLDEDGELLVRGPGVCRGYVGADAAASGWIRTGDLFEREGDRWWFQGRKHDRLNINGMTVSPMLTEKVIADLPGVREVVVTAGIRRGGADELVAVAEGAQIDVAGVLDHCRELLDRPQQPRRVVIAESLPKNAMGKVDRRAVREWLGDRAD